MSSRTDYVTKADLGIKIDALDERLGKRIDNAIKEMAGVFSDGMQMVSDRFDTLEGKVDDLQTIVIRMDNKLNDQQERLDYHEAMLHLLQSKVA